MDRPGFSGTCNAKHCSLAIFWTRSLKGYALA